MTYNERNQVRSITAPNSGSSSFGYDQAGRMVQRVDASGTTTYAWDAADRLYQETDPLTGQKRTYTWRTDDLLSSVVYAVTGGASTTYGYDVFGRVQQEILKGANNTTLRTTTYGYDAVSTRLSSKTVSGTGAGVGTNTYGYDLAGRLTSWTLGTTTATYAWDDAGNRTSAGGVTFVYDARNRLTSSSASETDTWTPRGTLASRVVSGSTTNYTFDGLGRMTTAGNVTYTYDALDRVTSRKTTGQPVQVKYAGFELQPVADGTNTIARSPDGSPIALKVGSGAAGVVGQDRHGDVVTLMSPTASAVTDTFQYNPFGERVARTGTTANTIGYQGAWTDPTTNLVDMGARWYSPGWGRFVSRDIYAGARSTPVSLNRYTYANNDPLGFIDPDGHKPAPARQYKYVSRSFRSADTFDTRVQLFKANAIREGVRNAVKDRLIRTKDRLNYDPRKDPVLKQLAHATVLTNYRTFDTAAKNDTPDGNISKQDFERVADTGSYDDTLQFAAQVLLADDKDVDHDEVNPSNVDPNQIENYGWKLYKIKKDQGFWDKVVGIAVPLVVGLVVGGLCGVAAAAATPASGGAAAVAGGAYCGALAGAAARFTASAMNGGSLMESLNAAGDTDAMLRDAALGGALGGVGYAASQYVSGLTDDVARALTPPDTIPGVPNGSGSHIAANQTAGNAARDLIAGANPGSRIEKSFSTDLGIRRVDVLTQSGVAIESKVGRTSLTSTIQTQIAKDEWLLQNSTEVTGIEWVFSRSTVTGQIGPTGPLADALSKAGITWSLAP